MNTSNKNQLNRNQHPPQAEAEFARPKAKSIKLGIDVHLDRYVAVRIIDGATPQPPQRRLIAALEVELKSRTQEVEAAAPEQLPVGLGKLTSEILEREMADWNRFKNRRQVASYTGLCPSEDSSSSRRFQGAINKHGNRRLRPVLVEWLWRLCVFQPEYRVVKKWRPELANPKTSRPRRKKIIVAMARTFAVDWWRVRTNRCKAEELGLKVQAQGLSATLKRAPSTEHKNP